MATRNSSPALECRCTRRKHDNSGRCGYQDRVLIDQNGGCTTMQEGVGRDRGPF